MSMLKIKNGLIAAKPGMLATSCAPSGPTCASLAGVVGPQTCFCSGAPQYAVCLSGFTGANAILNNNAMAWILNRTGGSGAYGTWVASSGSATVTFEIWNGVAGTEWEQWGDDGRSYRIIASVGGSEVWRAQGSDYQYLDTYALGYSQYNNCNQGGYVRGIQFSVKAITDWFPRQVRLTISGCTMCGPATVQQTGQQFTINSANLNGVYVLDLDPHDATDVPSQANYWGDGGSFSYMVNGWGTRSGTYRLLVALQSGSITIRAFQNRVNNPFNQSVLGDDLYAWMDGADFRCNEVNHATNGDIHTCPRAWGGGETAWVKTCQGGNGTVVALP